MLLYVFGFNNFILEETNIIYDRVLFSKTVTKKAVKIIKIAILIKNNSPWHKHSIQVTVGIRTRLCPLSLLDKQLQKHHRLIQSPNSSLQLPQLNQYENYSPFYGLKFGFVPLVHEQL